MHVLVIIENMDNMHGEKLKIYNSTCFGQTYCPSSGVSMTNTNCCEYSIKTPYDGVSLSETCRVVYQNKVEK